MKLSAAVRLVPTDTGPSAFAYDADVQLTDLQMLGAGMLIAMGIGFLCVLWLLARCFGEPERTPVARVPLHRLACDSSAPDEPGDAR